MSDMPDWRAWADRAHTESIRKPKKELTKEQRQRRNARRKVSRGRKAAREAGQ